MKFKSLSGYVSQAARFEYRPLPMAMQQFFSYDPKVWGDICAFASMITVPVLVVFLLFQKWFVKSVATSGINGRA